MSEGLRALAQDFLAHCSDPSHPASNLASSETRAFAQFVIDHSAVLDAGPASLPETNLDGPIIALTCHRCGVTILGMHYWTLNERYNELCEPCYGILKADQSRESLNKNAPVSPLGIDPIDVNPTAERWGWTRLNVPPEVQG